MKDDLSHSIQLISTQFLKGRPSIKRELKFFCEKNKELYRFGLRPQSISAFCHIEHNDLRRREFFNKVPFFDIQEFYQKSSSFFDNSEFYQNPPLLGQKEILPKSPSFDIYDNDPPHPAVDLLLLS